MPGQQIAKEINLPLFHRLRQQGVIGVTECLPGDIPGAVPVKEMNIHQKPHQLGYSHSRMGIIELTLESLMEIIETVMNKEMGAYHILQGTGDQKVLLFQPQLFSLELFIVGIKHLGNGFSADFIFHRAVVVTGVKFFKIKRGGSLSAPQPKKVNIIDLETGNRRIIRDAGNHPGRNPANTPVTALSVVYLASAAKTDIAGYIRLFDFPGIARMQPAVTEFLLPAVNYLLIKHAIFITNTVTDGRDLQRRE